VQKSATTCAWKIVSMKREELVSYLDGLLQPGKFRDYCPNGLQVEGCPEIVRIVAGVTASQALLDAAVERHADAILVHHGWFWKGEDGRVTGIRRKRLATLLANDINLLAYHLPLDAHPELGNNAQLAASLGWESEGRFGEQDIAWLGRPATELSAEQLRLRLAGALGREPLLIGEGEHKIRRIAWCTGGAQGYFEQAIALGVDAYVSGEISEQTTHLARESGVAYLACGHHATERFGVRALAGHLAERFGLDCTFVDIPNPV
jgi:dinuclear metal center YbgI/SA1388 family protein